MSSSTNNPEEENLDVDDLESSGLAVEENETDEISDELTDSEIEKEIKELANKQTQWIDIYKILVDTRKFEIENFWKRTVFFWGAIAILLAGYFNAKNSENFLVFVSYLGFFYNLIFSLSLRGSKYWQEHWEFASVIYERALNIRLFRWKLKERIYTDNKSVFFPLRPQKISVSKLTMILSDITLFLWIILITKDLNYLSNNNLLHFDFSFKNNIDLFTLAVVLIPFICLFYIILFLVKGTKIHDKK